MQLILQALDGLRDTETQGPNRELVVFRGRARLLVVYARDDLLDEEAASVAKEGDAADSAGC